MKTKNALNVSALGSLHYIRQRRVIIIIGAVLMTVGFLELYMWDQ